MPAGQGAVTKPVDGNGAQPRAGAEVVVGRADGAHAPQSLPPTVVAAAGYGLTDFASGIETPALPGLRAPISAGIDPGYQ